MKNNITKILATASVAALACASNSFAATQIITDDGTTDPILVPTGAMLISEATKAAATMAAGDIFEFSTPKTLETNGIADIKYINMNNQASPGFNIKHDTTLDGVTGGGANMLKMILDPGVTLTLKNDSSDTYKSIGDISLDNSILTINVANDTEISSSIIASKTDKGIVDVTSSPGKKVHLTGEIGAEGAKIEFLGANNDTTLIIDSNIHAKDIYLIGTAKITFAGEKKIIDGDFLQFLSAGGEATFSNRIIKTEIKGTGGFFGTANIEGGEVHKDIAALDQVTFTTSSSTSNVKFMNSINVGANNIHFHGAVNDMEGDLTLDSANTVMLGSAGAATTMNIGTHTLKAENAGAKQLLELKGDVVLNMTTGVNITEPYGHIDGNLDLSHPDLNTVTLNLDDSMLNAEIGKKLHIVVSGAAPALTAGYTWDDVEFNSSNDWDAMIGTNGITLELKTNSSANIVSNFNGMEAENLTSIFAAAAGSNAGSADSMMFANEIKAMGSDDDVKEALERLQSSAGKIVEMTNNTQIVNRLSNIGLASNPSGMTELAENAQISGAAAGCEAYAYGLWVNGFFNQTTQKKYKTNSGYKSLSFGGTLGLDARVNDSLVLGAGFTFDKTNINHKDMVKGDKSEIFSYMISVYGMHQLTDHWFMNSTLALGMHKVKNNTYRKTSTGVEKVVGKYDATSFTADAMLGYNQPIGSHVVFTPMFGTKYTGINYPGYVEKGSKTGQNAKFSSEIAHKIDVVAGLKISAHTTIQDKMEFIPEIHGFVRHDLIGKKSSPKVTFGGVTGFKTYKHRPIRTSYNVGAGISTQVKKVEIGFTYDLELARKRIGHEGAMTLRVNF